MGIKNTEFFANENGVEMRKDIYDNGMEIIQVANPPELEELPLSEQEQIAIDNVLNLEYLVCLMETNMV